MSFKENHSAQFILGAFLIFVAFKLWMTGFFSGWLESGGGFQSATATLVPILVDTVCLVGLLALTGLGILKDLVKPLLEGLSVWVRGKLNIKKDVETPNPPEEGEVRLDAVRVAETLERLDERMDRIEGLFDDGK